ncbi:MAG: NAD(P)-binding domain-containing protein [Muribaculum sp.]|nr:NAD(P)-binding domain-containing protein [Muribaculum sp.]
MNYDLGKVAVLGGGSWATALAKLLLKNCDRIGWYMRSEDKIDEFRKTGHNPSYLTDVSFEIDRIDFSADINEVASAADTLVVAMPSPYFLPEFSKLTVDLSGKNMVSAVKGIVPDRNMIITDYLEQDRGVDRNNMLVIGGPCHAEEVALERLSYLTIGCRDVDKARAFAALLASARMKTIISDDVDGIEYAAVLKNVYAIAAGMVNGMKSGDNFMAMLVSNSIREMRKFVDTIAPMPRDIDLSAYLGDLLVTAYSRFSRNHNFGSMIGKGYSVKVAMMEMSMVAEGYYGTKCIYEINSREGLHVQMPILNMVHSVLYGGVNARRAMKALAETFA